MRLTGAATQEVPLEHWSDFEVSLKGLEIHAGQPVRYVPLFRGLADRAWGLETTIERTYPDDRCSDTLSLRKYYHKALSARAAVETFSGRRWDKLPTPPRFQALLQECGPNWLDLILMQVPEIYEYLVYLRHHGFPSPLLDWTASPYVAAFFAFDIVPKGVQRVCVYALLPQSGGGSSDQHCFTVGPHMTTHPRHFLQQCFYSMCVGLESHGEYNFRPQEVAMLDSLGPAKKLLKFTIPVTERRVALQQLDLMNISPYSLFGSEDSLVRTIARRECYFKDWSAQ